MNCLLHTQRGTTPHKHDTQINVSLGCLTAFECPVEKTRRHMESCSKSPSIGTSLRAAEKEPFLPRGTRRLTEPLHLNDTLWQIHRNDRPLRCDNGRQTPQVSFRAAVLTGGVSGPAFFPCHEVATHIYSTKNINIYIKLNSVSSKINGLHLVASHSPTHQWVAAAIQGTARPIGSSVLLKDTITGWDVAGFEAATFRSLLPELHPSL